jgi:hypothetical protein
MIQTGKKKVKTALLRMMPGNQREKRKQETKIKKEK